VPTPKKYIDTTKSRFRSAGWAASEGLVNPLLQLLLTPFLLNQLGEREFGLWILALTFGALGPLLTAASSAAVFNRSAHYLATQDRDSAMRGWKTGMLVVTAASLITTLALFLLSAFSIEIIPSLDHSNALLPIAVVVALMFAQELDSVSGASLKSQGYFNVSAKIDIAARLLWVFTVALSATFFKTAFACIASAAICTALKAIIKSRATTKLLQTPPTRKNKKTSCLDRTILSTGAWYWGQALSSAAFTAADKFLVSSLFGLEALSSYAICSQIAQFAHGIQSSAGQILLPWASREASSDNKNKNKKLLRIAILGGLTCMILPFTLSLLAPYILKVWINPEFSQTNSVLAIALIFSYAMLSANIPLHYILLGVGELKLVTALNIAGGLISIIIGWTLASSDIIHFALAKSLYAPITMLGALRLNKKTSNNR